MFETAGLGFHDRASLIFARPITVAALELKVNAPFGWRKLDTRSVIGQMVKGASRPHSHRVGDIETEKPYPGFGPVGDISANVDFWKRTQPGRGR